MVTTWYLIVVLTGTNKYSKIQTLILAGTKLNDLGKAFSFFINNKRNSFVLSTTCKYLEVVLNSYAIS